MFEKDVYQMLTISTFETVLENIKMEPTEYHELMWTDISCMLNGMVYVHALRQII